MPYQQGRGLLAWFRVCFLKRGQSCCHKTELSKQDKGANQANRIKMKIFWTAAIYALSTLTASPLLVAPVAGAQAWEGYAKEVRRMLKG
jgi:hypothetical protein